ncbi:MAG: MATE family efflux transporter [Armatimonadetes bacterium]|nr:MATE family efflux transporter [Armatimonadota bacterium]
MDEQQLSHPRRRNEAGELIVSGRIWSAVWYLAWPTAVNTLILTAYNIINRVFLGRLPDASEALAAVGIGGAALMVQFALTIGLTAGTGALVAQFLGAEKYEDADEATRQSLILSVVGAVISAIPLIIWAAPLVKLIGAKGAVVPLAADYTAIITWSSIPLFVYFTAITALRSAGDVISALYAGAVVVAVNAVFDYLLIFGIGPFPAMGVHGAAIATGISRVAGMVITLWFLRRSVLGDSLSHFKPHNGLAHRIMRIGWPAMVQNLLWTMAYTVFIWILSKLPGSPAYISAVQAGLTLALTIESTAFMPGVAYAMAATPLMGQNIGAGKPDRAANAVWVAAGQAVAIMTFAALVFIAFPAQLAGVFTHEAELIPIVVWYLRINAISEPFLAVTMVLRGGLQGAGDTLVPALITLATNWVIRLPLAWYLAIGLGMGPNGAWIAMSASTVLSGVIMVAWFTLGKWRSIRV